MSNYTTAYEVIHPTDTICKMMDHIQPHILSGHKIAPCDFKNFKLWKLHLC